MSTHSLNIEFYGMLAEISGISRTSLPYMENTDLLRQHLIRLFPEMGKKNFIIAINNTIAQGFASIPQNATIACMPPFAGG